MIRAPLLIYPWIAGIFSGTTTTMVKILLEMIKAEGVIANLINPISYVIGLLIFINVVFQFKSLNMGIKYYS